MAHWWEKKIKEAQKLDLLQKEFKFPALSMLKTLKDK